MRIILTMATSANGMIASPTGSEDFLSHSNWVQFTKLAHKIGCFIWGRKTYQAVTKWEGDYLAELKNIKKIILSQSNIELGEGFELAHSAEEALTKLEQAGYKEVIITGGATLNTEFAKRGLIDEVILDLNPTILGEGIPIFQPQDFQLSLEFISAEKIAPDIIELHYLVKK